MSLEKCVPLCNHNHSHDVEYFHNSPSVRMLLLLPLLSAPSQVQVIIDLFSVVIDLISFF